MIMRNVTLVLMSVFCLNCCMIKNNSTRLSKKEDTMKMIVTLYNDTTDGYIMSEKTKKIIAKLIKKRKGYIPLSGYVKNEETAKKIAEAIWISIYGEKNIQGQKPFRVYLKGGKIWVVKGILNCPEGFSCVGGTAYIEIRKKDGKILKVIHGK